MDLHDQIAEMAARVGAPPPEASDITVAEYFAGWLPTRELSLRPATWVVYEGRVRRYVLPTLGDIRLIDLTPHDVQRLLFMILERGGLGGRPLSRRTASGTRAVMYTALQDAVRNGYLYVNPVVRAPLPGFRRQEARPRPIWSPEQLRRFLDGIAEHRYARLIKLTAFTGLRRGEVLGLAWRHVDFDKAVLFASQQLAEEPGGARVVRAPKSFARSLTIGQQALEALRTEHKIQAENRLRASVWHGGDRDLVFTMDNGKPIKPGLVTRTFHELVKESGLPIISFHHLRHTHASLLLLAGVPIPIVTQRLGHSDQWTTLDRYAHVLDAADECAANLFENLLQAARRRIEGEHEPGPTFEWSEAITMTKVSKAADR